MPRAATTLDPFNAIAESKRRDVLIALARRGGREVQVNGLVEHLGWPQPQVSKHLAVLREVGLVHVRHEGRKRMYSLNAERLKPIHDWVQTFEEFWTNQLDRIKQRAEQASRKSARRPSAPAKEK